MKDPHDIIIRPILTEKAYGLIARKRYVFQVDVRASKTQIKAALEHVFAEDEIAVESVNTTRTLGKIKRQGKNSGRTPETKKAYVTLKKDSKPIRFFEGMAE